MASFLLIGAGTSLRSFDPPTSRYGLKAIHRWPDRSVSAVSTVLCISLGACSDLECGPQGSPLEDEGGQMSDL